MNFLHSKSGRVIPDVITNSHPCVPSDTNDVFEVGAGLLLEKAMTLKLTLTLHPEGHEGEIFILPAGWYKFEVKKVWSTGTNLDSGVLHLVW